MSLLETLPRKSASTKKTLRILYAEDVRELREVAQLAFALDGHKTDCAADGSLAWKKISADPQAFDVVITDHNMPNMDGLELVKRLRALPFLGKIMIFSSEISNEVREAYERLKVDKILRKPIFADELRQVLAAL
ncbi:MAG: response regulator [Verrucomicrobiota bacterium]|nr:response regulator [Verrucomicrobiota bacterium]